MKKREEVAVDERKLPLTLSEATKYFACGASLSLPSTDRCEG